MEDEEKESTETLLTKKSLLEGVKDTQMLETSMGTFEVTSMTEGQKTKAEAMVFKGLKAHGGIANMGNLKIEGDAEQIFLNEANYDFYIIMCGLNNVGKEKWSIQEVKNIRFNDGVREELVARIEVLSNMRSAAVKAAEFFQNPPGDGAGEAGGSSGDGASGD